MEIHFGFSYTGLVFLAMLMAPNLIWCRHQPKDYGRCAQKESRLLLAFERVGEVSVTCLLLIIRDFNFQGFTPRALLFCWRCC